MRENDSSDRRVLETAAAAGAAVLVLALVGWWGSSSLVEPENGVEAAAQPAKAPEKTQSARTSARDRSRPPRPRRRSRDLPGQQRSNRGERVEYDPAVLRIVTNFKKADATVNGLPYPEYTEPGNQPGMVLPAGGPYKVKVNYNGKTKTYTLVLRPYEVRYLMVELSGFQGGAPAPSPKPPQSDDSANAAKNKDDKDGKGRVTVYSKPKGAIHVDGEARGQKTPGTVKVASGEHDIQVKFGNGDMSESKTVRVRKGSRIKLFFRKNE